MNVMDCCNYFGVGKSGCIFWKILLKINTNSGFSMCHNIAGTTLNNDVAIVVVEESKQNFTKWNQLRSICVCCFQHVAAHPSDNTVKYLAMKNDITK